MTNTTTEHDLPRPTTGRRLRVELREPIRALSQAICLALATFGIDVVDSTSDIADVIVWTLDAAAAAAADVSLTAGAPIVALVEGLTDDAVRRLYALGVGAVLDRSTEPAVIVATAVAVGRGLVVAQPSLFDLVPIQVEAPLLDRHELRWMRALGNGEHMSAIAHTEGHSERDMYRKLKGVYAKLGVSGRAEALVLLARADLLGTRVTDC